MCVQVGVGFIGTDAFHFHYAGELLALNTFGYEIIGLLTAAAFLLFVFESLAITTHAARKWRRTTLRLGALLLLAMYMSVALGSVLAAAVLRRHLMVWAVFAPKVSAGIGYNIASLSVK